MVLPDTLECQVSGQLRRLGIYGTMAGHKYLTTAIVKAVHDPGCVRHITKGLYIDISQMHHATVSQVERCMRTAIKHCWEKGNREALDQMAGFHLVQRPTNSEFIDLAANYFRR